LGGWYTTCMSEKPPLPEQPDKKKQVLDAIQSRGLSDPEVRDLYAQWFDERTREIEGIPNVEKERFVRAQIKLNVECARLYSAGGDFEYALEALNDALAQAEGEGCSDLAAEISEEIRRFMEARGA
jgi:hypothetical protein